MGCTPHRNVTFVYWYLTIGNYEESPHKSSHNQIIQNIRNKINTTQTNKQSYWLRSKHFNITRCYLAKYTFVMVMISVSIQPKKIENTDTTKQYCFWLNLSLHFWFPTTLLHQNCIVKMTNVQIYATCEVQRDKVMQHNSEINPLKVKYDFSWTEKYSIQIFFYPYCFSIHLSTFTSSTRKTSKYESWYILS